MNSIKALLNEIAQYPHDAYLSTKRIVQLLTGVHEDCLPRQKIELFASKTGLYIRNNFRLRENEHMYLLRLARRGHGYESQEFHQPKRKRWTFCWKGSAIYFVRNAKGNPISPGQTQELIEPCLECSHEEDKEEIFFNGPVLEAIKRFSVRSRDGYIHINNGMQTRPIHEKHSFTAHFAIAIARVSGKNAEKAAHPEYARHCVREIVTMSQFKVVFKITDGELDLRVVVK